MQYIITVTLTLGNANSRLCSEDLWRVFRQGIEASEETPDISYTIL
jgi:hypothetical protein